MFYLLSIYSCNISTLIYSEGPANIVIHNLKHFSNIDSCVKVENVPLNFMTNRVASTSPPVYFQLLCCNIPLPPVYYVSQVIR